MAYPWIKDKDPETNLEITRNVPETKDIKTQHITRGTHSQMTDSAVLEPEGSCTNSFSIMLPLRAF